MQIKYPTTVVPEENCSLGGGGGGGVVYIELQNTPKHQNTLVITGTHFHFLFIIILFAFMT